MANTLAASELFSCVFWSFKVGADGVPDEQIHVR